MSVSAETMQTTAFIAAMALTVVYLARVHLLFQRLEADHPYTFDRLGRPHLLRNNKFRHSGLLLGFLLSSDHHTLHDDAVSRQVQTIRLLMLLILALFAVVLANFFRLPLQPR